jgi:hypothetical protein
MDHEGDLYRADMAHAPRSKGRPGARGEYTHMLGQAAAMLVSFPAAITAEFRRVAFPVALHLGTFAGSAVATLGDGLAVRFGVAGRGFARYRRFLTGAVYASRQVRGIAGRAAHRSGFQSLAAPKAAAVRGHGERQSLSAFLHRSRDRGSGIGSGGGNTLSAGHTVIGIDCTERNRVCVGTLVGVERTREGQFLYSGPRPHHQYGHQNDSDTGDGSLAMYLERGHGERTFWQSTF